MDYTNEVSYCNLYFSLYGLLPKNRCGQILKKQSDPRLLARLSQLEELARQELGKTSQGKDIPPARRTLNEQIQDTHFEIRFYQEQLEALERQDLDDETYKNTKKYFQFSLLLADIRLSELQTKQRIKTKAPSLLRLPDAEDIKQTVDIVAVISEYIRLKKTGREYRGRCCFHPDRTPSLYVNPEKQVWKCHGCQLGGDVITFIERIEKCDFQEALRRLAR